MRGIRTLEAFPQHHPCTADRGSSRQRGHKMIIILLIITKSVPLCALRTIFMNMVFICNNFFSKLKKEEFFNSQSSFCIKGSLKRDVKFWEEIGASEFILETIKNVYIIPFYETPAESFNIRNKSASDNFVFVKEAVSELVKKRLCC